MVIREQKLRADRLVFYQSDVKKLETELDGFLELSGARSALLIDREGHLVTKRGEVQQNSLDSISALVAGSFAATREMARLLGEEEFSTLYAVVFDERTNLGMVRYYATETTRRLDVVLTEVANRAEGEGEEQLASDFSSSATAALDKLF
jgi:predicted regulator of Ras-like GTPase activity (Roadblock/LC7/MglB family)